MLGLAIGWQYLTGVCVATDPASRQRAEWPPHPGRVFMALAAAYFETGEDIEEGQALRWLEALGDPEIVLPPSDNVSRRNVVTVFVPVNDTAGPSTAILQSAPSIARSKQPRTFPSVWIGDAPCFLSWHSASSAETEKHKSALDRLCCKVTRIGHSSSLVRMWIEVGEHPQQSECWVPDDALADSQVRRVSPGTLEMLGRQFNRRNREAHVQLTDEMESLAAQKKTIRGKGAAAEKAAIEERIDAIRRTLGSIDAHAAIRPKLGLWSGYRLLKPKPSGTMRRTDFDTDLLVFTQTSGPRLPSASSLMITHALRGAVLRHSGVQPPPSWVSGHLPNSAPLRDTAQHLACLALSVVGSEHADGHLLGAALAFPRAVPPPDRGRVLGTLVLDKFGQPAPIQLTLGALGVWTMIKRDWSEARKALKPEEWTAQPQGARAWASVTPAVLDRFPKADPIKERDDWRCDVAVIIAMACQRIGLPEPVEVEFGTTSWHLGSPRASVKRRPLRGKHGIGGGTASHGDGFPAYPVKGSNGPRPQFHIFVRFAEPVVGPIILGAGRFLGYGLCKPFRENDNR